MKNKQGYILVLSLMLIFLSMFLATYIANRGSLFSPYARLAIERKQAYVLAEGGIQLAISQIMAPKVPAKKEADTKEKKQPSAEDKAKDMLSVILPSLNRWQGIELNKKRDGIDPTLRWCIMSENGKFDLNALYDFQKHAFKPGPDKADTKQALKTVFEKIKGQSGDADLFAAFEGIMKKRDYALNDPSELLGKAFASFANELFYAPPVKGEGEKRPVYLMDLFTVWSGKATLNPWLLSDSACAVMGLRRVSPDDGADRKKRVAEWLKPFKLKSNWQKEWNTVLKPLYQKEFTNIPKSLQPFLSGTFEAQVFSVLIQAKVGRVTQRLFAIIEIGVSKSKQPEAQIKKVYWL